MRFEATTLRMTRSVADGAEVLAFGDVHGMSGALDALLDLAAALPRRAARREVAFLGDLVDRGPDPVGAVALALGAGRRLGADLLVTLEGNHEAELRASLDASLPPDVRRRARDQSTAQGGRPTELAALGHGGEFEAEAALRSAFGAYLAGLAPWHRSGGVLLVHGGLHPRVPLAEQLAMRPEALWGRRAVDPDRHPAFVRRPFLDHAPSHAAGHHGLFVVHGHSPRGASDAAPDAVAAGRSRLNLDAGSADTGRLRMAVLRGDVAEVVEASPG